MGQTRHVNATVALLLAITLVVAVADWIAVYLPNKGLEYVCKPLTMVVLIGAVLAMTPDSTAARACFVAALVFSMVGDVFLMLPDRDRFFVFGLGAFLVGHLAYIPGLWLLGVSGGGLLIGVVAVGAGIATIGLRVVRGVREAEPKLALPVTVYMGVISLMVASAIATGRYRAIIGALLFYCSDALIAWTEFIEPKRWGKLAIIVTYHLGQIGLAISLV